MSVGFVSLGVVLVFLAFGLPLCLLPLPMVAPPAGVGKMPKQFNSPVINHHEVVAIFNEVDGGF